MLGLSGCATLGIPGGAGRTADQLTAAVADFQEGTRDELVLSRERIEAIGTPDMAAGTAPEVRTAGAHGSGWLESVVRDGLASRICGGSDECAARQGVAVLYLSTPRAAGRGVFIDADLQTVRRTGAGTIRSRRLLRLQVTDDSGNWRVVAATPIWEM